MSSTYFHRRVPRRLDSTGRRDIGIRSSSEEVCYTPSQAVVLQPLWVGQKDTRFRSRVLPSLVRAGRSEAKPNLPGGEPASHIGKMMYII